MTAHDLARLLLAAPDAEVMFWNCEHACPIRVAHPCIPIEKPYTSGEAELATDARLVEKRVTLLDVEAGCPLCLMDDDAPHAADCLRAAPPPVGAGVDPFLVWDDPDEGA